VSLYCDRGWLEQVNERAASRLDAALRGDEEGRLVPRYRAGPHIGATLPLLRDIVRANRDDPLHWLYACAKANELLYATLSNNRRLHPAVRLLAEEGRTGVRLTVLQSNGREAPSGSAPSRRTTD
jgi:hypothetical protein